MSLQNYIAITQGISLLLPDPKPRHRPIRAGILSPNQHTVALYVILTILEQQPCAAP
jgi:hypothetical protein